MVIFWDTFPHLFCEHHMSAIVSYLLGFILVAMRIVSQDYNHTCRLGDKFFSFNFSQRSLAIAA